MAVKNVQTLFATGISVENNMDINYYTDWTKNTCAELNDPFLNNIHMLLGMATEIGELLDAYKKNLAYKKHLDIINVQEEIGDLMFYIASFCRFNNLNLNDIIENNIKKLETRYPEKFTQYRANNRNLEKEREVLEELKKD